MSGISGQIQNFDSDASQCDVQPGENVKSTDHYRQSLFDVVRPAIYVVRAFGLAPYELPRSGITEWPRRPWLQGVSYSYTLLLAGVNGYTLVTTMLHFESLDKNEFIFELVGKTQLILNYLTLLVNLGLGLVSRDRLIRVWISILKFDETFKLRPTLQGDTTRLWTWSVILGSVGCWALASQLGIYAYNESYLRNLSFVFVYLGTYVALLKFCGLVVLVAQRFAYLNRLVRRQAASLSIGSSAHDGSLRYCNTPSFFYYAKIERTCNDLLDLIKGLNDIYSWSLFIMLPNLFVHIISNMYFFIIWLIVDPNSLKNTKSAVCTFSWLVIFHLQQFIIHAICHFAADQANDVANILLELRRRRLGHHNNNNNIHKQDTFRSTLHLLNRKFFFCAAGCYNVNLPSLTSTFGALTTYLVILVQLSGSKKSHQKL